MRTTDWFETRIARARARIHQDADEDRLGSSTLEAGMREITDDSPSEDAIRLLAEALNSLSINQYRYLLQEVHRWLTQEADRYVDGALRAVEGKGQQARTSMPQRIEEVRAEVSVPSESLYLGGVYLQALIWALNPPLPRSGPIVSY